jgi:hypothetical protein
MYGEQITQRVWTLSMNAPNADANGEAISSNGV